MTEMIAGENSKEAREKSVAATIDALARQLAKNWHNVKTADEAWDFRTFDKALTAYSAGVDELTGRWTGFEQELALEMEKNSQYIASEEYAQELEQALTAAGIPLQGAFPQYEFVPFKLTIALEEKEVRLGLGKKNEKTTVMQPQQVAKWVAARYQKLIGRRFDADGFMRELLAAYRIANKIAYREGEVIWGRAVALEELYELLTLRRAARQEYPRPLFLFNLGRLKEQVEIKVDGYQFEFGFPRNQEKAVSVFDSRGRESRVSSLSVHKAAEA